MMPVVEWSRRIVLTILIVTQLIERPAAAESIAGWVEGFEGKGEHYVILRNGQRIPVAIFMPLLGGDEVVVKSPAGPLRLALGDGGFVTEIRSGNAPYVVQSGDVPTLPRNLMRWATGSFTSWNQTRQSPVVGVHVRAGRPILLPPFDGPSGRLQAGTRPLFLAWKGGKAPYRVTLVRDGADGPLLSLTEISQSRVRTQSLVLASGTHILVVEDAHGDQDRARVTVVPPDQVPVAPDELVRSRVVSTVRTTLFAAWLASRNDGEWIFEAYQQASTVAIPGSPAELLRDALERGERPTSAVE